MSWDPWIGSDGWGPMEEEPWTGTHGWGPTNSNLQRGTHRWDPQVGGRDENPRRTYRGTHRWGGSVMGIHRQGVTRLQHLRPPRPTELCHVVPTVSWQHHLHPTGSVGLEHPHPHAEDPRGHGITVCPPGTHRAVASPSPPWGTTGWWHTHPKPTAPTSWWHLHPYPWTHGPSHLHPYPRSVASLGPTGPRPPPPGVTVARTSLVVGLTRP